MEFKTLDIANDWRKPPKVVGANPHKIAKLENVVGFLDEFVRLCRMPALVITSFYRPTSTKSYHSKLQAVDVRIHKWPVEFRKAVISLFAGLREFDEEIQLDPHYDMWGTPNEHFHIEIDDNTL